MSLELISPWLRRKFTIAEREHACAILAADYPEQFHDILDCLAAFVLKKSYIQEQGGGRSPVSYVIDGFLSGIRQVKKPKSKKATKHQHSVIAPIGPVEGRGWREKRFDIKIEVDGNPIPIPTHSIDNFKQLPGQPRGVGVEVEWNRLAAE